VAGRSVIDSENALCHILCDGASIGDGVIRLKR